MMPEVGRGLLIGPHLALVAYERNWLDQGIVVSNAWYRTSLDGLAWSSNYVRNLHAARYFSDMSYAIDTMKGRWLKG